MLDRPLAAGAVFGGGRLIAPVASGTFSGPRLSGRLAGSANADWPVISADGHVAAIDARMCVQTHDGAIIFLTYTGRLLRGDTWTAYVAPVFETGDASHQWLNSILAVGKGEFDSRLSSLHYDFFELR